MLQIYVAVVLPLPMDYHTGILLLLRLHKNPFIDVHGAFYVLAAFLGTRNKSLWRQTENRYGIAAGTKT